MTTNSGPSSTPNPRKFAEKIALLKAKEAESTAQFDHVMRDVHGSVSPNANQIPAPASHCMDPRYAQQQEPLPYAGSLSTSAIPNANSGGMVPMSGNQMAQMNHGMFGNMTPKGNSSSCIPSSMSSGLPSRPMRPIWEGSISSAMHPSSVSTSLSSGAGLLPSDSPKIYASNSLPNFPMAMMSGSQGNNMMSQQQALPSYSQSPPLSLNQQRQGTVTQQQHQLQSMSRGNHPQNLNFKQQSQNQHSNSSGVDLQGALHSLENIKTGGRQYVMDQLNKRIMKHMSNTNTVAALGGSRNTGGGGSAGGGSPHHHHNHHHHNHHHHSHHHHLVSQAVPTSNQPILGATQRQRNNASSGSSTLGSPTSTNHRLSGPPCVGLPTPPPGGYTAALLGSDAPQPAPPPPPYQLETPQFSGVLSDNWRRTASDSAIHTSVLHQQQQHQHQQQQQSEHLQQTHQQFYQSAHHSQQPQSYMQQQQQQPLLLPTLLSSSSSNPMHVGDDITNFHSASSRTEQQPGAQLDGGCSVVKRCPSGPIYSTGDNGMVGAGLVNNLSHSGASSSINTSTNVGMVGSLPDLSASNTPHQNFDSVYSNASTYPPPAVTTSYAGPNSVPASVTYCQTSNPTSPSSDAGVTVPPVMKNREVPTHPASPHTAMHLTQQQFERFNMNECDSPPILPVSMAVDSPTVQPSPLQSQGQEMNLHPMQQDRIQPMSGFGPEAMIEMAGGGRIPDIILTEPEVERRDSFNLTREVLSSLGCTSESLDSMMDFTLPQTDVDQLLDVDDSDLELLNDTAGLVHYVADPAIEEQLRKEHKQLHQL